MTTPAQRPTVQHSCAGRVFEGSAEQACVASPSLERDGHWWCRQHDPVRQAARRAVQDVEQAERRAQEQAIVAEGRRLATRLGVDARAHYRADTSLDRSGYQRSLVISFAEVETLIERLKRAARRPQAA